MSVGTGLKASALVCLPGLSMNGLMERVVREYLAQGFVVRGYYGGEGGTSLGFLYQISNASSASGNADSQIDGIERAARKLVEIERKSRLEIMASNPTNVEDSVFGHSYPEIRAYIALNEAMDLGARTVGLSVGFITGEANKDYALMYRVQSAHIALLFEAKFIIEEDVRTDEMP
jgi:protein-arginine kinase